MLPVVLRTTLIIGMFCYFILLLVFFEKKGAITQICAFMDCCRSLSGTYGYFS